MQPPENFIKLLDDWCYLNADCNLPAWVSAVYRDKDMSNEFIDYLGELLDLKQG